MIELNEVDWMQLSEFFFLFLLVKFKSRLCPFQRLESLAAFTLANKNIATECKLIDTNIPTS